MTVVALAAALAALVVALVLLALAVRRVRRTTDARVSQAVEDLNARMESMVFDLQLALEQAQEEGRRGRYLGALAGSLDLDEVIERVLEAASTVRGGDAALLALRGDGGTTVAATRGLAADEAAHHVIAGPPDGRDVRSISLAYRYAEEELAKGEPLIHGGVAVPVRDLESEPIGMLAVFTRAQAHAIGDGAVSELEQLAASAGPAIENARRFREARQLADLDALTGLHNRRYFHETLAREVARAHRYQRELALIVFDLDDFKAVNDRIGHLAGDAVLAEIAERVRLVVRSADVACRIGGDEFGVIMAESSVGDARQLSQRLQTAVSAKPIVQAGRLEISAGVAALAPSDDAVAFFERADEALYRAKEAGKGRIVSASLQ